MVLQIPNISAKEKQITFDEFEIFLAYPENQGRLFELIHGRIVEKVPTQAHGMTVVNIATEVKLFSRSRGIGRVGVEILHRLATDEYNGRQPDLSFYLDTETPVVTRGAVPKMPDLAVEVKSPTDTYNSMRERADYYLRHGTLMVWLVYPEKKIVEVYQPDTDVQILVETDVLDGGDVLPGFTLAVSVIFAE